MIIDYNIGTENEAEYLEEQLHAYNVKTRKIIQSEDYKRFVVTATIDNEIVGGGVAYSSLYFIGYLDTLWVNDEFRNQFIGSTILELLEEKLKDYGCELCHLDTFDFQAPNFYIKKGYKIFGELHYKKSDITEFFLKKSLDVL